MECKVTIIPQVYVTSSINADTAYAYYTGTSSVIQQNERTTDDDFGLIVT